MRVIVARMNQACQLTGMDGTCPAFLPRFLTPLYDKAGPIDWTIHRQEKNRSIICNIETVSNISSIDHP